jgi:hypothetical protein
MATCVMMKRETLPIADIYVPVKRRATLDQKRAEDLAENILAKGQQSPILVRCDGKRYVSGRRLAPAGGLQGAGRGNDHRLPGRRAEALAQGSAGRATHVVISGISN